MMIRIFKWKSPFSADRNHIHHRVLKLGLTHLQTTLILVVVNGVFILCVFLLQNLNMHLLLVIIFALGIIKSFIPKMISKRLEAKSPPISLPYKNVSKEVAQSLHENGFKMKN